MDGVDFSPEMLDRARAKTAGLAAVALRHGDAAAAPLEPAAYDAVLCLHVLWALPDPVAALRRWIDLLRPGGVLVLADPAYWGREIADERYLVRSAPYGTDTRRRPPGPPVT